MVLIARWIRLKAISRGRRGVGSSCATFSDASEARLKVRLFAVNVATVHAAVAVTAQRVVLVGWVLAVRLGLAAATPARLGGFQVPNGLRGWRELRSGAEQGGGLDRSGQLQVLESTWTRAESLCPFVIINYY